MFSVSRITEDIYLAKAGGNVIQQTGIQHKGERRTNRTTAGPPELEKQPAQTAESD